MQCLVNRCCHRECRLRGQKYAWMFRYSYVNMNGTRIGEWNSDNRFHTPVKSTTHSCCLSPSQRMKDFMTAFASFWSYSEKRTGQDFVEVRNTLIYIAPSKRF